MKYADVYLRTIDVGICARFDLSTFSRRRKYIGDDSKRMVAQPGADYFHLASEQEM